jgi:pimeloyl-ACP methyl ester carboxylesterase
VSSTNFHPCLSTTSALTRKDPAAERGEPLFLIHSGQGDVVSYGLLARLMEERPIYGLQSVGLQGESWPLMTIPAMARQYLPEVLAHAPTGPVHLAGTCMGGLVAFELAQMLLAQGREVGLLALLDTHYPLPTWKHRLWRERLYGPWRDAVRDGLRILRWRLLRAAGYGQDRRWLPAFRRFVSHMNSRANRRYRPGFYPGKLTLFLSAEVNSPADDRRHLMQTCAREPRIFTIPGKRANLFMRPSVEVLAHQLHCALERP